MKGPKLRGAVAGVIAGLFLGATPSLADLEREAALEAYHMAMEAYVAEALDSNVSGERFLCGYGISNRTKTTRTIAVKKVTSLAAWHTDELVCAESTSRELISATPSYGLSGFEFGFKNREPQKLNGVGVAFQSRALERVFRRNEFATVPSANDIVGDGEITKLRFGRALIPLAWKLRLAEEALKPDADPTFGSISPAERVKLQMLMAYLGDEAEPDEDAYTSYKDRLFPGIFKVLDNLSYAYFDGPEQLSAERIARELFLLRYLNDRTDAEKAFQLATEEEKVSLISDLIRQSDMRRALTLLTKLDNSRDQDFAPMPIVYSHFRDLSGNQPITDKVSYVPLNWERVREAARPVDEDWADRFMAKSNEALEAGRAMRRAARALRGEVHTEAAGKLGVEAAKPFGSASAAVGLHGKSADIRVWDAVTTHRFSSGETGLTAPESQAALAELIDNLDDLSSGLSGKVWAEPLGDAFAEAIAALHEVRDLEQDSQTQERLSRAVRALEGASKTVAEADVSAMADGGTLSAATSERLTGLQAGIYDLRGALYEGHAALFRDQTTECSHTCDVLIEPPGFDAELVLSGFFVGHTGGKAARLSELSITPGRTQGFDVLRIAFRDKDGYENNAVFVQYTYVPRSMVASNRAQSISGVGTATRDVKSEANDNYRLLQSFSIAMDPAAAASGGVADVMIEQLGIRNTPNQTRVLLKATGKNDEDVTGDMVWTVTTVDIPAAAITRPESKARPYVWPFK